MQKMSLLLLYVVEKNFIFFLLLVSFFVRLFATDLFALFDWNCWHGIEKKAQQKKTQLENDKIRKICEIHPVT